MKEKLNQNYLDSNTDYVATQTNRPPHKGPSSRLASRVCFFFLYFAMALQERFSFCLNGTQKETEILNEFPVAPKSSFFTLDSLSTDKKEP